MTGIIFLSRNPAGKAVQEISTGKVYNQEELQKHNQEEDCWISVDKKVYDVTLFLKIYPENIKEICGKVLNEAYFSEEFKEDIEKYQIGILK